MRSGSPRSRRKSATFMSSDMVAYWMAYSVRQSEALPVADTLIELWRRNLDVRPDIDLAARLRWYYRDAPAGPARVMLLEADGTVVGCEGIGVRRFFVDGEPVPAALLGDLAVDRKHRTLMPAMTLMKAARETAREHPLHYGFPNPAAIPLFDRLGYHRLGVLVRWVRVLRYARYIGQLLASPMVARFAGAVLDGARQVLASALPASWVLEPLADVDERLDRLWEDARRQWGVIAWRGTAFLRWRFLRPPGSGCELVALAEPGGSTVRAYAVLEVIDTVCHVRDFLGVTPPDVGHLLDLLAPYLYRRGATAISLSFLGSPRIDAMLRAHHFIAWS